MNIQKTWTLEFWKDGRIERFHTFEATPEQALTTGRVLLVLNQPEAVAV
jgi:hypothetical protein